MLSVRAADASDVDAIHAIYDHYVATSHCTFDLEPRSPSERLAWFERFAPTGRHRLLVATLGGEVAGYATSHRFRDRPAYAASIETSVYVRHDAHGRGIARRLYDQLFAALAGEDVHRLLAGIALPNAASVALHERLGFRKAGHFTEQGRKFGRWWDVAWYERPFP